MSLISLYDINISANLVLEMSWLNSSFDALVYDSDVKSYKNLARILEEEHILKKSWSSGYVIERRIIACIASS